MLKLIFLSLNSANSVKTFRENSIVLVFLSDKKPKWPPIDNAMLIDQLGALLSHIQILSFAKYLKYASVMVIASLCEKRLFCTK